MTSGLRRLLRRTYPHFLKAVDPHRDAARIAAFISIPKNASKTVLSVLGLGPDRDREFTDSLVIYESHQRAALMARRFPLDDLFVFCVARNPYDRCVSWYAYHRGRGFEPYRSLSFDAWVRRGMPHHWRRVNQTNFAHLGLTPLLQHTFVDGVRLDFVARMERLDADFAFIVDRLNAICRDRRIPHRFRCPPTLPATNTSTWQLPRTDEYYTEETRAIVGSLLEKDFTHFGYQK